MGWDSCLLLGQLEWMTQIETRAMYKPIENIIFSNLFFNGCLILILNSSSHELKIQYPRPLLPLWFGRLLQPTFPGQPFSQSQLQPPFSSLVSPTSARMEIYIYTWICESIAGMRYMATTMTIKWKDEEEQVRTRMACQRDRCCHFLQYF